MRQKDYVALGLAAVVVAGTLLTRKPASASGTPSGPPSTPTGPVVDPGLLNTIAQAEAAAASASPEARAEIATKLEATAAMVGPTNPAAAAALLASATRIRAMGGGTPVQPPPPPPPPPPRCPPPPPPPMMPDVIVQNARMLIQQAEERAASAPAAERELLAQQLFAAADQFQNVSPRAAQELREHAACLRVVNPSPPTPFAAAASANDGLLQRFDALSGKATEYLNDATGTIPMDVTTLAAMDRTATELHAAGEHERAGAMVAFATAGYTKRGIPRPMASTL